MPRSPATSLPLTALTQAPARPRLHVAIRYGLVARIPGSHPGGSGSIPGIGNILCHHQRYTYYYYSSVFIARPLLSVRRSRSMHTPAMCTVSLLCPAPMCAHPLDSPHHWQRQPWDEVAEWLRRWTANPMGSARVSSNLILVVTVVFQFSPLIFTHRVNLPARHLCCSPRPPTRRRSHGVMVSTQDSESCDPSSNLGGTSLYVAPTGTFTASKQPAASLTLLHAASIAQWLEHQSSKLGVESSILSGGTQSIFARVCRAHTCPTCCRARRTHHVWSVGLGV